MLVLVFTHMHMFLAKVFKGSSDFFMIQHSHVSCSLKHGAGCDACSILSGGEIFGQCMFRANLTS